MIRRPADVHNAIDTTLSGASHDPTLFNRVVNASKGGTPPMKKKLTLSMAIVLVLVLLTSTAAVAAAYRGVTYFLTESTCEPQTLDSDYLMNALSQYHTSHRLLVRVVDAYWDGVELSVAYRVTPLNQKQVLAMHCNHPEHAHYQQQENADILLEQPLLIGITAGEELRHTYSHSISWVCEKDGAMTVMITFQVHDLSDQLSFRIPIINLRHGTDKESAYLHFHLPTLPDPIAAHTHEWLEATCVNPKTCTICRRTEGDLGKHDFADATCLEPRTCRICGNTSGTRSLHHQYDQNDICKVCGHIKAK